MKCASAHACTDAKHDEIDINAAINASMERPKMNLFGNIK